MEINIQRSEPSSTFQKIKVATRHHNKTKNMLVQVGKKLIRQNVICQRKQMKMITYL